MTLRERKKPVGLGVFEEGSPPSKPVKRNPSGTKVTSRKSQSPQKQPETTPLLVADGPLVTGSRRSGNGDSSSTEGSAEGSETVAVPKKLPRVILRMGPAPSS